MRGVHAGSCRAARWQARHHPLAVGSKLARHYAEIDVDPSVLFVDEGPVLTAAVASGLDLCLHLHQHAGADLAARTARRVVVPAWRDGGGAVHRTRRARRLRASASTDESAWMEENALDALDLQAIATHSGQRANPQPPIPAPLWHRPVGVARQVRHRPRTPAVGNHRADRRPRRRAVRLRLLPVAAVSHRRSVSTQVPAELYRRTLTPRLGRSRRWWPEFPICGCLATVGEGPRSVALGQLNG